MDHDIHPDFITGHLPFPVHWWKPGRMDAWRAVWVSPEFTRLAGDPSSWLSKIIAHLALRPIGWFDPPASSRFYFSAFFMNAVMRRSYDNPLVQDLYVLHEALHAATIDDFFEKIPNARLAVRLNEIEVSLETECRVYLREPSWSKKTFDPLWISEQSFVMMDHGGLTPHDHEWFTATQSVRWPTQDHRHIILWLARRRATRNPQSPADHLVAKYERLADRWLDVIEPWLPEIFAAHKILSTATPDYFVKPIEDWSKIAAQHQNKDGLPWGDGVLGWPNQKQKAS